MNTIVQGTNPAFASRADEQNFLRALVLVMTHINQGVRIDDILNGIFESFGTLLPFDRIGFAMLDAKAQEVEAVWAKCRYPTPKLGKGYRLSIKGSSLEHVLKTGQPRILSNLDKYLVDHPASESTRLMLEEGIHSSLTCPITHGDNPIGFLFFSSTHADIYKPHHVEVFSWIVTPLAIALDKAQLYERLVNLNKEKNLLLGVAAHDLRSPIAQIQTMCELLTANAVTENERKEIAGLMITRCQSMLTLLHDLLDLTAIEAGRLPLRFETVHVKPFCESLIRGIEPLARAKKITLKLEGEVDLEVKADPARLSQAVDNLLTNAIKYSPPQSTVHVRLNRLGSGWTLTVADEGQGIAESDLKKLFKPFSRTETTPTAGEEQVGLGLAIVKKIVEAHGGDITVQSQLGSGACFQIFLPNLLH